MNAVSGVPHGTGHLMAGILSRLARRAGVVARYVVLAVPVIHSATAADPPPTRFDGHWDTVLTCPDSNGALGFVFSFVASVSEGKYHGEQGTTGQPGWFTLDGEIATDGSAHLLARGLVGGAQFAVGSRPAGTPYAYHVDAHFDGRDGTGRRVEGRPCSVTFSRKP
jgi:hypothetical protein